jgi:uncharacterized membrane protein YkvA (DUF1232 family)
MNYNFCKVKRIEKLKERARKLKKEVIALHFACLDRRTPWLARMLGVMVVGYALSPIDLIPDFIPVLGLLDDLLLLPLGIALALKMVPRSVMDDARARAEAFTGKPESKTAMAVIVIVWILLLGLIGYGMITSLLN